MKLEKAVCSSHQSLGRPTSGYPFSNSRCQEPTATADPVLPLLQHFSTGFPVYMQMHVRSSVFIVNMTRLLTHLETPLWVDLCVSHKGSLTEER